LWYWLPCFVIFVVQPMVQVIAGNRPLPSMFRSCPHLALLLLCCINFPVFQPVTCQLDRLSVRVRVIRSAVRKGYCHRPPRWAYRRPNEATLLEEDRMANPASLVWGLLARRLLGQLRVKMRPEGGGQLSAPTGHCAPMGNSRASHDMPTISHSAITAVLPRRELIARPRSVCTGWPDRDIEALVTWN
jgi:hypothetical protein